MSTDLFHQVMSPDLGVIVLTVACMLVAWSLPAVAFEMSTTEAPCPPGYYTCETGYCIPNSFLCDGDTDCFGGSDERDCLSTTVYTSSSSSYTTDDTEQPLTTSTKTTTMTQSTTTPGNDCFLPFQSVGGRCVFVDPFVEGSWTEMRYRCEEFGSVLLEVDEPNFFLSVVQFIKEKGLEGTSYWIGGRKDADDDLYYWDGSRTHVTSGTPFWAIYAVSTLAYYEQEPDASGVEQCILLNKDRQMYFSDMDCDATVAGVVCQRDPGPLDSPTGLITRCYLDNFACDFSTCVSRFKICDGVKDCRNNADEAYCQGARSTEGVSMVCADTQFQCDNGNCVWSKYVCNGDNDCYDFTDERNCDATTTAINTDSITPLPSKASLTIVDTAPSPSTSSAEVVSNTSRSASEECSFSPPYQSVGGKCIFVEPFVEGSWEQMRYRCGDFGGILLEMEDPNLFLAVVEYIIENGIDNFDYWIGGRKDADDDLYYWEGSRTNVTMGTPFWAIYKETTSGPYGQEPEIQAVKEACLFLNKNRKLFFSSTDCDVTTAGVICQLPQNQPISLDVDDVIM